MSNAISKGTTPRPRFNLPFETSAIRNMEVYFSQDNGLVLEKKMEDCELSGSTVVVPLSQADTLMFNERNNLYIQFRFVFDDEYTDVDTSKIITTYVKKILKESEIDVD